MNSSEAIAFFAIFVLGPFFGSFGLDLAFGTRTRWWRWWFSPLVVGLAAVGFVVWLVVLDAVTPDEPGVRNELGWPVYVLIVLLFVLVPVVVAACAVGLRRWAAGGGLTPSY